MTRKLSTLFAAAAIFASTATATVAFAAESAPQPPRTQGQMVQMSPDQMAQMTAVTTNATSAPTEPSRHFQATHPGGRYDRGHLAHAAFARRHRGDRQGAAGGNGRSGDGAALGRHHRGQECRRQFLVSPGLTPDLAAAGIASGLPYLPGAVTASEILAARELNFSFLKFFPAREAGGPALLRSFAPVFQGIVFCPTGGINEENVAEYLALPNVPVVGGTWVANREAIDGRDWSGITARAKRAVALRDS
ncbi:MAG: hypothetical protein WDN69_29710 [Aliidongia sp.]